MYKRLELCIFESGLTKMVIAEKSGMTYNTFLLKLKGKYKFTLDEAIKLKAILKTKMSIEELFCVEDVSECEKEVS